MAGLGQRGCPLLADGRRGPPAGLDGVTDLGREAGPDRSVDRRSERDPSLPCQIPEANGEVRVERHSRSHECIIAAGRLMRWCRFVGQVAEGSTVIGPSMTPRISDPS